MNDSGRRHAPRYTRQDHGSAGDARLFSPAFERNARPIIETLTPYFEGRTGTVVEIGAGTGQHAAAFALAFPGLEWIATDPFEDHRRSISAWANALLPAPREPLELDATRDWAQIDVIRALGPLLAVYAGNVTHIAPWAVTEGILSGAATALAPGGFALFYGPFRDGETFFGEGNRAFDRDLRADNPEWGLRDIASIRAAGGDVGLRMEAVHPMPANNHILVLRRT
ncbi:DUF938 domain-containing protein [Tropicimonas isoalkanivorans]|uniref:SAM-dependent methyltransferase n=1 Tax=Tropicimonas isoalkanivorans TaxID=441112 RepID=A0A1I1FYJ9_9RHOB|nr:DUF938 domain-containing protein [Tropicimonas isoalkanivorans]SFC04669.1 Protein of unknown function [Tropicimonas isoalkanivorans]